MRERKSIFRENFFRSPLRQSKCQGWRLVNVWTQRLDECSNKRKIDKTAFRKLLQINWNVRANTSGDCNGVDYDWLSWLSSRFLTAFRDGYSRLSASVVEELNAPMNFPPVDASCLFESTEGGFPDWRFLPQGKLYWIIYFATPLDSSSCQFVHAPSVRASPNLHQFTNSKLAYLTEILGRCKSVWAPPSGWLLSIVPIIDAKILRAICLERKRRHAGGCPQMLRFKDPLV